MFWWGLLWAVLVALAVGFMAGASIASAGNGRWKGDRP
jgi:hypothetical protein